MRDPVSALAGASFTGFAAIRELGPFGMITLRAKAGTLGLEAAVFAATGCNLPQLRAVETAGNCQALWMSPDEYLLIMPYAEVGQALGKVQAALAGQHFLAVDVSDARAYFRIEGEKADQVLRKLSPTDFDTLAMNVMHRTRLAQVAAGFWRDETGFSLICFRSVASYAMGLLTHSAAPGSELSGSAL